MEVVSETDADRMPYLLHAHVMSDLLCRQFVEGGVRWLFDKQRDQ